MSARRIRVHEGSALNLNNRMSGLSRRFRIELNKLRSRYHEEFMNICKNL